MIPPEERDWDKYLSKDNHSREELNAEEQELLRAYEESQKEIDQSGIPKWISDIFSYTPLDFKCSHCNVVTAVRDLPLNLVLSSTVVITVFITTKFRNYDKVSNVPRSCTYTYTRLSL
jgi:hypothetical protein